MEMEPVWRLIAQFVNDAAQPLTTPRPQQ